MNQEFGVSLGRVSYKVYILERHPALRVGLGHLRSKRRRAFLREGGGGGRPGRVLDVLGLFLKTPGPGSCIQGWQHVRQGFPFPKCPGSQTVPLPHPTSLAGIGKKGPDHPLSY